MASQEPSPAQGPSSTAANAKIDKAKKWAAFRAQSYDGEGWGDEYGDDDGSPPHRPGPAQQEVPPSTSPEVAGFASNLPPSVVSSLASAQNGSRSSLPSQVTNPRMSTDLTRGIVVSGGTGSSGVKRTEGRDSPNRRSWVEQRSSSPKPTGPGQPQEPQNSRTASDAPTTPIAEADESSRAPPNKRFSRSPQLPDLARMSMFGDDLFKSPVSEEPPPPMPALPPGYGGEGLGVKLPDAAEGAVASPTASTAQQTPPQITSASPSAPPAERPASRASSGDTAAQNNGTAAQSDSAATSNIPQKSAVSSPVSEGAKTPDSQHAAPTLGPSGIAGQAAPAESTSNVSSINEPSAAELTRELSPSPLRSMSPAQPAVSSRDGSARGDASADATSPAKQASANGDASEPAQPAQRTTINKAPRQSDLLREEIIKSLGRAASTGEEEEEPPAHQRQDTQDSGNRESTYLPSVYDDYWEDTAENKDDAAPEVPSLPSGTTEEVAIAPLRPGSKSPAATSPPPLRKRFSWEQGSTSDAAPPTSAQPQLSEAPAEPPTDAAGSPVAGSSSPSGGQGTLRLAAPGGSDSDEAEADVARNESQFSKATAVDPDYAPKRLSLAAEKEMEGSSEHLPTEPVEDHPALRDSPGDSPDSTPRASPKISPRRQSLKTVSFREIMSLATSRERVAKFNETRLQYAGLDQGLDSWIITLKARPEHAGATTIFNANVSDVPVISAAGAKGQPQSPTAASQPYYQQYLNASSANVGAPGRSTSGGLASTASASAFKHGSNQAGVKSKELLLAAGKAGKGLLSKGKYKLRGSTSDKNESSTPQPQAEGQIDRSASGGVRLGAGASSSVPPAQQPQSAPTSPNATSHDPPATQRPPNGLPPLQPPPAGVLSGNSELVSPVDSDAVSRLSSDGEDVFAPQGGKVSAPAAGTFLPWAPVMGSPLAEGERSGGTAGGAIHGSADVTGDVKGDDKSDDWVVISPQLPSAQAQAGEDRASRPQAANKDEGASSTDVTGQEPVDKSGPARPPSFAGLPALRRSSTFEPTFGDKAKEAVGEDSDDEDQGAKLAREGQADKLPTIADVRFPTPPLGSLSKDAGDAKPIKDQARGNDEERDGATATAPVNSRPATDQQPFPAPGPGLGRDLPEHMTTKPLQRPPPHGQWNLQESYLSEPLISPSRKRPTSPSSRAESYTELDKETGAVSVKTAESSDNGSSGNIAAQEVSKKAPEQPQGAQPSPAMNTTLSRASTDERGAPVTPRPRPGPKFGITPPVSMQRYRGLFASKQQPAVYGQPGQPPPSQSHPNLVECSGALGDGSAEPRPRSSSRPPTADGRRGSGIFSQIGERFAKMNPQGEPVGSDAPSEEMAPAPDQRHRRRSSFFLNLKRGEAEQGPKSGDSNFANPPSTLEARSQASPSPEEPPKRSFFGVGNARTATAGSARFIPALGRSSTGAPEGDGKEQGKQRFIPAFSRPSTSADEDGREGRPRFGGLGRFRRTGTSDGPLEKPGSSGSMASSILGRPATGASVQQGAPVSNVQPHGSGHPAPLPLPPARGRSGTTGSMPGVLSPLARATAPPEERGRKVNGPGAFLSNMWHTRSPSRSKEGRLPKPSGQPQLGPSGLPLGMAPVPGQQGFAHPPPSGKPRTPVHQRQTSVPSPGGSPLHQRQVSMAEPSSPLSRRSATVESTPVKQQTEPGQPPFAQRTMAPAPPQVQTPPSPSQANQGAGQGPQMQDWRPVPVQKGAEGTVSTENAAPVSKSPRRGDSEVKDEPATKPNSPTDVKTWGERSTSLTTPIRPSEDQETGPAQNVEGAAVATDAEKTPEVEKPQAIHEPGPNDKDGEPSIPSIRELNTKDGEPSVPSISEPPKVSSPTPSSRSAASRLASPAPEEDRVKTLQNEGPRASSSASATSISRAPTSSDASFESTPSRSQGGVSLAGHQTGPAGDQTPRASSPAMSQGQGATVSSPTQSRVSVGQTVSPAVSTAASPAPAQGGPARAPAQLVPQGVPAHGQLPQVPHQTPAQPAPGPPVQAQPIQGSPQGQWRPFPGPQLPPGAVPPGFQAQPVPPQAPSTAASQHSNSPVQFQPMPAPQGQQPGQGRSGVSKWFKEISSSQQQQGQQPQSVQGKAKSLFGALKRSSKPSAANPPAAQPQVAQQGQQPGFVPAGYPQQYMQPQHGQQQYVMHPQWGMIPAPAPYQYGPVLEPGQQLQGGQPLQPGQQFMQAPYPGAFQPMPYAPGQVPFQPYPPNQVQGHHSVASSRQPSVASNPPQSATTPSSSPAVQGPSMVPGQPAAPGTPQSIRVVAPHPTAPAGPQVQNNAGARPSETRQLVGTNKPLPVPTLVNPESQVAQPPTTEASKTVAALEQAVRSSSLGQTAGHSRDASQASLRPGDARNLTVDTEAAGRKSDETNLYDATPRGVVPGTEGTVSVAPAPVPREDTNGSAEPATQSTEPATQATQSTTQDTEATTQDTKDIMAPTPGESRQQEMIRKMRLEAQDEKILVPGQEGLPGAEEEPEDPDKPKMSATSYPGQEWNPYGGYEFGYD